MREEAERPKIEIRLEMQKVRHRMQDSRKEMTRLSKARKHWPNYVREVPLLAAGSAFCIGYLLIPKKKYAKIPLDTKETIESTKNGKVKMVAPKSNGSSGIMKASLKMAGRSLLHAGIRSLLTHLRKSNGSNVSNSPEQ